MQITHDEDGSTLTPFTLPPRHTWIDHTSVIHTDRASLYNLLSDIDHWPAWTPGLKGIRRWGDLAQGKAGPGSRFLMTLEAPIVKRLYLPCVVFSNRQDRIEWGGGALGSTIRHYFELTPLGPNQTQLRHVERASGLLALLAWPGAGFAHMHDLRWSRAIEDRFAQPGVMAPGRQAA